MLKYVLFQKNFPNVQKGLCMATMMRGMDFAGVRRQEVRLSRTPLELFTALEKRHETAFLLESSDGASKKPLHSYVGFGPGKHVALRKSVFSVESSNGGGARSFKTRNPLLELKREIGEARGVGLPGFVGGALGYVSFDYFTHIEKLPAVRGRTGFPAFEFGIFDDVMVFDHAANRAFYLHGEEGGDRLARFMEAARDKSRPNGGIRAKSVEPNMSEKKFCSNVEEAKEHIRAGDIFQVVLSRHYRVEYAGRMLEFYRRLREMNPSPYMYYLKFGNRHIVGSSPENLIRLDGRDVVSYATLAGTRPRGKTPREDARLERDLLEDPKERAEHLMLVDLTRNDLGKVCDVGSVHVPTLMRVQKYSHVQHISSVVRGDLAGGMDSFDAFRSIFPAGTLSGAPKIRAIEILRRLEGAERGPYGGAVGYFSANGSMDHAITIRTLCGEGNTAYVQSGAGIVYDSVPKNEFLEVDNKARALMRSLGVLS